MTGREIIQLLMKNHNSLDKKIVIENKYYTENGNDVWIHPEVDIPKGSSNLVVLKLPKNLKLMGVNPLTEQEEKPDCKDCINLDYSDVCVNCCDGSNFEQRTCGKCGWHGEQGLCKLMQIRDNMNVHYEKTHEPDGDNYCIWKPIEQKEVCETCGGTKKVCHRCGKFLNECRLSEHLNILMSVPCPTCQPEKKETQLMVPVEWDKDGNLSIAGESVTLAIGWVEQNKHNYKYQTSLRIGEFDDPQIAKLSVEKALKAEKIPVDR